MNLELYTILKALVSEVYELSPDRAQEDELIHRYGQLLTEWHQELSDIGE